MSKISNFKNNLGRVFDDNLHTKVWHNVIDYVIIGLIIISTIEVFLSTYESIAQRYGKWLYWVDHLTTYIFTIEIILRIWCADIISPKFKGFWGRVRYCFTFYGLIDILSTFPFYINFIVPLPITAFKALRIARLMRIFRYMKAFHILKEAVISKKKELVVSAQFLIIITLILSFILYFVEHEAQPEVYDDGSSSVIWAFCQYIGDPGNFADTPPVTIVGKIIACVIGILGIAIFAVPAGLIGSGFTDAMDEDRHSKKLAENVKKVRNVFERKLDRPTGYQIVKPYLSIITIQARSGLTADEIIEVVDSQPDMRLINLAAAQCSDEHPNDRLAVEIFHINRPYGCCIDRGSDVTIVSVSSLIDPIIGHFSYYLAKMGGFNYVSRENGQLTPYKSFYKIPDASKLKNANLFLEDLNKLTSKKKNNWVFAMLAASGANEPAYPTEIHVTAGGKRGEESIDCGSPDVIDKETFKNFVTDLSDDLKQNFDIGTDFQRYHDAGKNNQDLFTKKTANANSINSVSIRVAWSVSCWNMQRMLIAKHIAQVINREILHIADMPISEELKRKDIAYNNYKQ